MFALPYEMSQSCFLNNYKIIYLFLKNYSAFQKFLTGKKCAYCSAMIMTCSLEELRVLINSPALLTLAVKQTSVVGCLVLHVYLVGFLEHALSCCCHSNHIVSVIVRQSCCCWAFPFPPHSCAKVSFKKDCQTEVSVMCFILRSSQCWHFPSSMLLSAPVENQKISTWQTPAIALKLQVIWSLFWKSLDVLQ